MNREEYLRQQLARVHQKFNYQIDEENITRAEYLAGQLERINSEVLPCPGAQTTPDVNPEKMAYFGLRVVCTLCDFTVEAVS